MNCYLNWFIFPKLCAIWILKCCVCAYVCYNQPTQVILQPSNNEDQRWLLKMLFTHVSCFLLNRINVSACQRTVKWKNQRLWNTQRRKYTGWRALVTINRCHTHLPGRALRTSLFLRKVLIEMFDHFGITYQSLMTAHYWLCDLSSHHYLKELGLLSSWPTHLYVHAQHTLSTHSTRVQFSSRRDLHSLFWGILQARKDVTC